MIFAFYFGILIIFSLLKVTYLKSRTVYLLRAFFPSWKFFDDIGEVPVLFYRVSEDGRDFGGWKICLEKSKRSLGSLFLNPQGNFLLACESHLQHLLTDLEENSNGGSVRIENSVSYQLTKKLVRFQIMKRGLVGERFWYQFKLSVMFPGEQDPRFEEVLLSPVFEV